MKYTKEELTLIWLDSFVGLEYKYKLEIYDFLKDAERIKDGLYIAKDYIINAVGENEFNTMINSANQTYLDYLINELNSKDIFAITFLSKNYPESLSNIEIKPLVLYVKGNVELLKKETFAIVGSRKSLPISIALAEKYTSGLIEHFTLITGIAEGVDSTVIKTALEKNGNVISVIAGGFDNVYPSVNKNLLEKVMEKGLVLSEYPPNVAPKPFYFPIRNRIFAGLAKGVLIVSGAIKSGTLYTAEYAGEYGKDLFAIPYSVGIKSGEGCNELIKRGAILTDKVKDILEFYNIEGKKDKIQLTSQEKEIVKVLSDGQMHIEKLSNLLNKRTFEIMPVLSSLEIKGIIIKSGNIFELVDNYSEE